MSRLDSPNVCIQAIGTAEWRAWTWHSSLAMTYPVDNIHKTSDNGDYEPLDLDTVSNVAAVVDCSRTETLLF